MKILTGIMNKRRLQNVKYITLALSDNVEICDSIFLLNSNSCARTTYKEIGQKDRFFGWGVNFFEANLVI